MFDLNCRMETIQELVSESHSAWTKLAAFAADPGPNGLAAQPDEVVLDLARRFEEIARLVGVSQVQVAAEIDNRSKFADGSDGLSYRHGHRHAVHFVEAITQTSQSEAKRRIRMGKDIRSQTSVSGAVIPPRYPEVAKAVETGRIAVPVAERIIQSLEQARKHHTTNGSEDAAQWEGLMTAAEEHLVDEATRQPHDSMGVQITAWRDALDPDGAPLRDEEIHAGRGFRQGKERNGITRNTWDTDGPVTAMLKGIFEEAAAGSKPRFFTPEQEMQLKVCNVAVSDPEETAARLSEPTLDGTVLGDDSPHASTGGIDCDEFGTVEAIKDNRTKAQRDSDVLTGYLRAGIRASENEMGGMKPIVEVTAVVTLADLQAGRGVGWIDGLEESVSVDTIKEMACENGYRPIIVGDTGAVLWLGKEPRYFTEAQRRAVIVRDGAFCAIEGCTRPARQCHMHHVIFHSRGGPSDIDNAVLLCSEHHHMIHKSPFKIMMRNGRPHILAPRWIDPTQSWTPMGSPRFTKPEAGYHRPGDYDPTSGPDESTNATRHIPSVEELWADHPDASDTSNDPSEDDLWAGLPTPNQSGPGDESLDDWWSPPPGTDSSEAPPTDLDKTG